MTTKRAVVFDLDGTLLNTLPDIAAAMNKVLSDRGLPTHPERAYRLFTGDGALNLTKRALGEKHQDRFEEVAAAYAAQYAANSRVSTAPYPGLPEALQALSQAGLKLCVLSNKDDEDAKQVVAHYFPGQRFDIVRGRLPHVPIKPDPTALHEILDSLDLKQTEVWYVGDTRTDMTCALNAGLERVAVTWGFQTREEIAQVGADHYVDDAKQLVDLLIS